LKGELQASETSLRVARKKRAVRRRPVRRTAILVLGMHRSGTSAVTRVLNLLGADLPGDLLPTAPDNPRGFWESRDLVAIHDELLAAAGSSWDDWSRIEPGALPGATAARLRARLLAFLAEHFDASRLFVLKDPRMCRLVPFWRGVLQEFHADVRVVIPVRNPVEVAASLADRNGFSPAKSQLVWLRHVLDAERDTRDLPRCVVRFGSLLHDRERVLGAMRRRLALRWPRSLAPARARLDGFLAADGRHYAAGDGALDADARVSPWMARAHETLAAMAGDGDGPPAQAALDAVAAELDRAIPAVGGLVAEHATRVRDLAAELDDLRGTLAARTAELEALASEHAGARSELDRCAGDVARLREAAAETAAALATSERERTREVDGLRATIAGREADLARIGRELAAVRAELSYARGSFSWQLTAPLRTVRRVIGRRAHVRERDLNLTDRVEARK
jgi:hypothetical protein